MQVRPNVQQNSHKYDPGLRPFQYPKRMVDVDFQDMASAINFADSNQMKHRSLPRNWSDFIESDGIR